MKHTNEQIEETRDFLKKYNVWRRSNEDMEMLDPKEIGKHIDRAIDILEAIK